MPATHNPTLLERVLVERTGQLLTDEASSRVRRSFLAGETLTARQLAQLNLGRTGLTHAVTQLESLGYKFERWNGPYAGPKAGRPKVYYKIVNLDHVPTEPVKKPARKKPAPKAEMTPVPAAELKEKLPAKPPVTAVREMLVAGKTITLEALILEGIELGRSRLSHVVTNARKGLNGDIVRTVDGGYRFRPASKVQASKPAAKNGTKKPMVIASPKAPVVMIPPTPNLGIDLTVVGVSLDDDNRIRVALRNGAGTWVTLIEGYHAKQEVG